MLSVLINDYLTRLQSINNTKSPTKPPLLRSPTIAEMLPITLPKGLAPKTTSIATLKPISDTTKLVTPLTKLITCFIIESILIKVWL